MIVTLFLSGTEEQINLAKQIINLVPGGKKTLGNSSWLLQSNLHTKDWVELIRLRVPNIRVVCLKVVEDWTTFDSPEVMEWLKNSSKHF